MGELTLHQFVVPKQMSVFSAEIFEEFIRSHGKIYERGFSSVAMWMSGWVFKRAVEALQESKDLLDYRICASKFEFIQSPAPNDEIIVSGTWEFVSPQFVRMQMEAKNQNQLSLVHGLFDLQTEKSINRKQS